MLGHPIILCIFTICLWCFGPLLGKLISVRSEFLLLNLSFLFSFLTFSGLLVLLHGRGFFGHVQRMRLVHALIGLFGYFIYWICFTQSFREFTSASGTTVLNYTWPLFTVLFTELIFRRSRKPTIYRSVEAAGIVLGFLAVVVLSSRGQIATLEFGRVRGLIWGICTGASYGLFSAYSSRVPREQQALFLFTSAGASLLAMIPFALSEIHMVHDIGLRELTIVFALGSIIDGAGYVFWTRANRIAHERKMDISSVASVAFALPLLSVTVISLFLGEGELLKPYFAVTLLLLVSGSVLCQRAARVAALLGRLRPQAFR
jgi:drug/metabolite transporter (DMT)-like permease